MNSQSVRVVFPNGLDQLGIVVADDVVAVGPIGGVLVNQGDVLELDGERREVTEVEPQPRKAHALGHPESRGWDPVYRITHRPA